MRMKGLKGGCFSAVGKTVNSEPKEDSSQKSAKSKRKWFRKKKRVVVSNTIQPEATTTVVTTLPPVPILPTGVPPTEAPKLSGLDKEDVKHAHMTSIIEPTKLSGVDKELAKHSYSVALSIDKAVEIVVAAATAPAPVEAECASTVDPLPDILNEETTAVRIQTSFKGYRLSIKSKKRWFKKKKRTSSTKAQVDGSPVTTTVPPSPIMPLVELPRLSGVNEEQVNHTKTATNIEPTKLSVMDDETSDPSHVIATAEPTKLSDGVDNEGSKHDYTTPIIESVKLSGVDGDSTPAAESVINQTDEDKEDLKQADKTPIVESRKLSEVVKEDTNQASITPTVELGNLSGVVKEDSKHGFSSLIETSKPSKVDTEQLNHACTNPFIEPKNLSGDGKRHPKHSHRTRINEPKKLSGVNIVDKEDLNQVLLTCDVEQDRASEVDYGVVNAAAKVSEAVFSAAQTAVEVVRLSIAGRFADNTKEEMAAIKIQTIYRGYLARRRLRAIRGLLMFKSMMKRHVVKHDGSNTRKSSMQRLAGMQSFICESRLSSNKGECGSSKLQRGKPWSFGNCKLVNQ